METQTTQKQTTQNECDHFGMMRTETDGKRHCTICGYEQTTKEALEFIKLGEDN